MAKRKILFAMRDRSGFDCLGRAGRRLPESPRLTIQPRGARLAMPASIHLHAASAGWASIAERAAVHDSAALGQPRA